MDKADFKSNRAGTVVRTAEGYDAFVPAPLPPSIAFDAALVRALSEADAAVGHLRGVGSLLPNPYLLVRPFSAREAVLSSRIEGTHASLSDLFLFEAAPTHRPAVDDVREVFNYADALRHGLAPDRALPISLRLIRELHGILMRDARGAHLTPGEFRRSQNWIGPAHASLPQATYVPPPVEQMHGALADLEMWLHADSDLPPLVRLAIIHWHFEAIHPFLDGNGRVGRLLVSLLLCEWRLLDTPLLYLSVFFERHRTAYYDGLLAVSQRGEWEAWITFFLEGVATQARDAIARAKRLLDLRDTYTQRLRDARAPAASQLLIDALFERPIVTVANAMTATGLTYPGAAKNLRRLEGLGIIDEMRHTRRPRAFVAREILRMIDDEIVVNHVPPAAPVTRVAGRAV